MTSNKIPEHSPAIQRNGSLTTAISELSSPKSEGNTMSRREVFTTCTVASAAVVAAAAPALASEHPDAELLTMAEVAVAAHARQVELYHQADNAYEMVESIQIPDALRSRPSDYPYVCFRLQDCAQYEFGGELCSAYENGIEDLTLFAKSFAIKGDAYKNRLLGEAERARTREIISAHERWRADIQKAEDAAGYTAFNEAGNREEETITRMQRRSAAIPAQTAAGIRAKARLANLSLSGNPRWAEETYLPRLTTDSGVGLFDLVSISLLVDALNLNA